MKLWFLFLLCTIPLFASIHDEISLALELHDLHYARSRVAPLLEKDDHDSLAIVFSYLAAINDTEEMKRVYDSVKDLSLIPTKAIETICWATIQKSATSYHPRIRAEALFAAAATSDAKALPIIEQLLKDPHPAIQELALMIAGHFPDPPIQAIVRDLAKNGNCDTKISAASLLIQQQAEGGIELATEILLNENIPDAKAERLIALLANDKKDLNWITTAIKSPHYKIRAAACAYVQEHPHSHNLIAILPLLEDSSVSVQKHALETVGLWQHLISEKAEEIQKILVSSLEHSSMEVASTAAWALFLSSSPSGAEEWFVNTILNAPPSLSLIACSRLTQTGSKGVPLAKKILSSTSDTILQLNISLFLLKHRAFPDLAAQTLATATKNCSFLLNEYNDGIFSWFNRSFLTHHPIIPRLPESQDLLIRLHCLALQSYAGKKIEQKDVEVMLKDRSWSLPATAAHFIFRETSTTLEEVLTPLLTHDVEEVRIQAALLLTIITQSQEAALVLFDQYKSASKEGKENILLGFSSLAPHITKELLIPVLFDESPTLKTRAAGVLLSSLYS